MRTFFWVFHSTRVWKLAYLCRSIFTWEPVGQELLDGSLALVRGGCDELVGIVGRQVRSQQAGTAQMELPLGNLAQQNRVFTGGPGDLDPFVGHRFGHVELLCAVLKHARERPLAIEPASIDLSNVQQELYLHGVLLRKKLIESVEQSFVRLSVQRTTRETHVELL